MKAGDGGVDLSAPKGIPDSLLVAESSLSLMFLSEVNADNKERIAYATLKCKMAEFEQAAAVCTMAPTDGSVIQLEESLAERKRTSKLSAECFSSLNGAFTQLSEVWAVHCCVTAVCHICSC